MPAAGTFMVAVVICGAVVERLGELLRSLKAPSLYTLSWFCKVLGVLLVPALAEAKNGALWVVRVAEV